MPAFSQVRTLAHSSMDVFCIVYITLQMIHELLHGPQRITQQLPSENLSGVSYPCHILHGIYINMFLCNLDILYLMRSIMMYIIEEHCMHCGKSVATSNHICQQTHYLTRVKALTPHSTHYWCSSNGNSAENSKIFVTCTISYIH